MAQGTLNGKSIKTGGLGYPNSLSLRANHLIAEVFKNAMPVKTITEGQTASITSDDIYIGTAEYSTDRYFPLGRYFCYRIYARALTVAEIAANYHIDRERFGW